MKSFIVQFFPTGFNTVPSALYNPTLFFISVFSMGIPFGWFRSVQRGFEHEPSVGEIIHTDLTPTVGADGLG